MPNEFGQLTLLAEYHRMAVKSAPKPKAKAEPAEPDVMPIPEMREIVQDLIGDLRGHPSVAHKHLVKAVKNLQVCDLWLEQFEQGK